MGLIQSRNDDPRPEDNIEERSCNNCGIDISTYPVRFKQCRTCFNSSNSENVCNNCGVIIEDKLFDRKYCSKCYPSVFPTHNTVQSTCFKCQKRFLSLSIDMYKTLCPACRPVDMEKVEDQLAKQGYSKKAITWLNNIMSESVRDSNRTGKEPIHIQHALNGGEHQVYIGIYRFSFDGYCKETNTVYEFYGDKWHGNPRVYKPEDIVAGNSTADELYLKTKWREEQILKAGYNLVTMWEYDFDRM